MNTYRLLAQEIVLCVLKDYKRAEDEGREEIKEWVQTDTQALFFVAKAMAVQVDDVRRYIFNEMQKI